MNEDRRNVYDSAEINDQQEEYKEWILSKPSTA